MAEMETAAIAATGAIMQIAQTGVRDPSACASLRSKNLRLPNSGVFPRRSGLRLIRRRPAMRAHTVREGSMKLRDAAHDTAQMIQSTKASIATD
jgi:hypothetical protein